MKKLLTAALLLLLVMLPVLGLCGDDMKVIKCDNWVSLRKGPDSDYERIVKVPLDATVKNCSKATNGYHYCEYNGKSGYIKSRYLRLVTETPNIEGVYARAKSNLATRKGPGTSYKDGGTYRVRGQKLKLLARHYDGRNDIWWVKVEIPYKSDIDTRWTGAYRFNSFDLEALPIE